MAAYNLRYIYLAVFVCLNIVKACFPDLIPEFDGDILLPVWAMGGTTNCYVSVSSGLESNDGLTPATPKATITQGLGVLNALAPTGTDAGAGHNLYIESGTYAEVVQIDNANMDGSTITGVTSLTTLTPGHGVIIDAGTSAVNGVRSNRANVQVRYVEVIDSVAAKWAYYISGTGNILDHVKSLDCAKILIQDAGSLVVRYSKFEGASDPAITYPVDISGSGSGYYNIWKHSDSYAFGTMRFRTGTWTLYNDIVTGSRHDGILTSNTATLGITNSILGSVNFDGDSPTGYSINNTSGTVTLTTSIYTPNWYSFNGLNNVTDGGGNTMLYPKFRSPARVGLFSLTQDDNDLDYAEAYATAISPYKHTFFVNTHDITLEDDYAARLQALSAAGTEIALHSYSHTALTYANALRFSQSGGSNPTVTFDGTTITCNCDGTDYDQSYVVTGKTLGEIITALNGVKGWTVAKSTTGSQTAAFIGDSAKASSLAALTETAAPCDIKFDRTGYNTGMFKDEITDPKAWLEAITGKTITAMSYPYGLFDDDVKAAVKDAGFLGALATTTGNYPLESLDIYKVYGAPNAKGDGAEATVIGNINAQLSMLGDRGAFYGHNSHNTTDYTAAQLGYLKTAIATTGITPKTFGDAVAYVRTAANGWTTADDITYTRTWTDASDYRLRAGSPAINAGTDVSLTTDFDGKPIRGLPDIGAYEYYGATGNFGFCFGMGF